MKIFEIKGSIFKLLCKPPKYWNLKNFTFLILSSFLWGHKDVILSSIKEAFIVPNIKSFDGEKKTQQKLNENIYIDN